MLLWQDAFCQVFYERASPILRGKHGIAVFLVYSQVVGFALGLGLSLHPCLCLTNRNPLSVVFSIGWSCRRTHKFYCALPSAFFGPFRVPQISIELLLEFCDAAPLSSRHSPLMSSILPCLLPLTGLPWWELFNPPHILASLETFLGVFQLWIPSIC